MRISVTIEVSDSEYDKALALFEAIRLVTSEVQVVSRGSESPLEPVGTGQEGGAPRPSALTAAVRHIRTDHVGAAAAINEVFGMYDFSLATNEARGSRFDDFYMQLWTSMFCEYSDGSVLPTVVPFIECLALLSPDLREKTRSRLVSEIFDVLSVARPVNCNRRGIFLQAEAFAAMVARKLVKAAGAVSTIVTMVSKPENQAAGLTMLGKTIELALAELSGPDVMGSLRRLVTILQNITDPALEYDVAYSLRNLAWVTHSAQSTPRSDHSPDSSPRKTAFEAPGKLEEYDEEEEAEAHEPVLALAPHGTLDGVTGVVYAMAYNASRDELTTALRDGAIVSWSATGVPQQTVQYPCSGHFICNMDVDYSCQNLFACSTYTPPKGSTGEAARAASALVHYRITASGLQQVAVRRRPLDCQVALRSVRQPSSAADMLAAGESLGEQHTVSLYDVLRGDLSTADPTWQGREHKSIVTCIGSVKDTYSLVSGGRDGELLMWDTRSPAVVSAHAGNTMHSGMITSVDIAGMQLLSSSVDGSVLLWDMRKFDAALTRLTPVHDRPDGREVLAAAFGPAPGYAAVATGRGLCLVGFTDGAVIPAAPFPSRPHLIKYHVLRWNHSMNTLYAGGDRVDVFSIPTL